MMAYHYPVAAEPVPYRPALAATAPGWPRPIAGLLIALLGLHLSLAGLLDAPFPAISAANQRPHHRSSQFGVALDRDRGIRAQPPVTVPAPAAPHRLHRDSDDRIAAALELQPDRVDMRSALMDAIATSRVPWRRRCPCPMGSLGATVRP